MVSKIDAFLNMLSQEILISLLENTLIEQKSFLEFRKRIMDFLEA
jgi:hypothetical protein